LLHGRSKHIKHYGKVGKHVQIPPQEISVKENQEDLKIEQSQWPQLAVAIRPLKRTELRWAHQGQPMRAPRKLVSTDVGTRYRI
jgi:hypothetical protein